MTDQRIAGPYGDIVQVVTPTLDNWAKQLYVQQRTREARQMQENQALDQILQKDFANIRSVDTPDVVNSYNKYKQLKKNLLFNKDLQRDPLLYNKAQQQAMEEYSNMQSLINKSREVKDMTKTMTADRFKNPDAYADDYGQRAATLMNTPISSLQAHPQYGDLTNWDQYRYQGSNTNFNDIVSKIYDKKNKVIGKEEPLDSKGIQFRSPVYEYGTAPAQVYEGLINSLDHKTERDAAYKWKQLNPEVVQKIEQDYSAIPKTKWEQMGLLGPQQINLRGGSDAEKYMRLLAMQNAINTNPRLVNYENRTSDKAKMDYNFWQDKVMEGIRFGHQKQLKKSEQQGLDNWIVNYWDKRIGNAKSGQPTPIPDPDNPLTIKMSYQIQPDQVMMKGLARNNVEPDAVFVTADNKIMPVFYKYQEDYNEQGKKTGTSIKTDANGNPEIDKDLSKPMDLDQAYLSLGYRGETKKKLAGTMSDVYGGGKSEAKPRKVVQNGHTYILNEKTGEYE